MRIKIVCSVISLFLFLQLGNSQNENRIEFTLDQAIDYALSKSQELKKSQLEVQNADAQIQNYWASGIPKISGSGRFIHNIKIPVQFVPAEFVDPTAPEGSYIPLQFGTKQQVTASVDFQALIFSGSFFVGLKAQNLFKELMQKNIAATEVSVAQQVTKAYYNVLIAQENMDVLESNLNVIKSSMEESQASFEAGFIEAIDVDRLKLSVQNLETEIKKMESTITLSKNMLKFQMEYPLEEEIELSENIEELSVGTTELMLDVDNNFNPSDRPEYKPLLLQQELNEINIKSIRAGYLPSLTGIGNYQQNLSRDNIFKEVPGQDWVESYYVGLNLSVPIFDGLEKRSRVSLAKVDLAKAELQLEEFEQSVQMQVKNARINFSNSLLTLKDREESVELAQNIFETTRIKFKEGVGSSTEIKQAERELYTAQSNYINALYDVMNAYVDLQVAKGELKY